MKAFISYSESGVRHVHEALFSAADGWIDEAYASMDSVEEAKRILAETEPFQRFPILNTQVDTFWSHIPCMEFGTSLGLILAEALQSFLSDDLCPLCGERIDREKNKRAQCGSGCCSCHRS